MDRLLDFRGFVGIPGYNFGSSGHNTKTSDSVLLRFVRREATPTHVKSVARTPDVYEYFNAHQPFQRLSSLFMALTPRGQWRRIEVSAQLRLNHYKLKSREEYIRQKCRTNGYQTTNFTPEEFESLDLPLNQVEDRAILTVTAEQGHSN